MTVYLRTTTRRRLDLRGLERATETLLAEMGERGASVALSLVGDAAIRRMNRDYRGNDRPTDVLSFPLFAAQNGDPKQLNRRSASGSPPPTRKARGTPHFAAQNGDPEELNRRSACGSPPPTRKARGAPVIAAQNGGLEELNRRSASGSPALVPERLLGDVVISVDTAQRQADGYEATLDDELRRLLIHGMLHLVGHDHEEAAQRTRMEAEERRLAAAIGLAWPY